jgi:uncharacterized membrane protein YccC
MCYILVLQFYFRVWALVFQYAYAVLFATLVADFCLFNGTVPTYDKKWRGILKAVGMICSS